MLGFLPRDHIRILETALADDGLDRCAMSGTIKAVRQTWRQIRKPCPAVYVPGRLSRGSAAGISASLAHASARALRCFALARGGAYGFSGGSGVGAGLGGSSFARMLRSVPIRGLSG